MSVFNWLGTIGIKMINTNNIDFVDFGCSDGANISRILAVDSTLKGLGIDIDESKLKKAKENGFNVVNFDILKLPNQKLVKFVTMSHFLEHLPSVKFAEDIINCGINISSEFVFIRQPWFDSDGILLFNNLKLFWSDWSGHPNNMTTLDFYLIFLRALKSRYIYDFSIFGRGHIVNSSDECLIPLKAPHNSHKYDKIKHGEKSTDQELFNPVYKEVIVIARIKQHVNCEIFLKSLDHLHLIKYESISE